MEAISYPEYEDKTDHDSNCYLEKAWDCLIAEIKESGVVDVNNFITSVEPIEDHLDQYLGLHEASDIMERCSEEVEHKELLEGLSVKESFLAVAFWSYQNDVQRQVTDKLIAMLEDEIFNTDEANNELIDQKESLEENADGATSQKKLGGLKKKIEDNMEYLGNLYATLNTI